MTSNILISIIIPVHNSSKYLNTCIDSILNNDYKNIEIIIIDDNSNDDSLYIAKSYAKTVAVGPKLISNNLFLSTLSQTADKISL